MAKAVVTQLLSQGKSIGIRVLDGLFTVGDALIIFRDKEEIARGFEIEKILCEKTSVDTATENCDYSVQLDVGKCSIIKAGDELESYIRIEAKRGRR